VPFLKAWTAALASTAGRTSHSIDPDGRRHGANGNAGVGAREVGDDTG